MDHEDRQVVHLWNVRRTLLQMLRDRKYQVTLKEIDKSLDDFRAMILHAGHIDRECILQPSLFEHHADQSIRLAVFFPEEKQVSVQTIRNFGNRMAELQAKKAIIVIREKLSSQAKTILGEVKHMEQFMEEELLVNITEHVLVPRHILLTDDEKRQLLQRYRLKESQLPRIQDSDPVARYYGFQRGQVVKIVRPSETAGRYVTYRLVS